MYVETKASLADGLTVPTVGVNAFATGAPLIDKVGAIFGTLKKDRKKKISGTPQTLMAIFKIA